MSKYHGYIGYADTAETYPGVWEEQIVEREYYGDVIKNRANIQQNADINGKITISNNISIIGDPFAHEHFYSMRYITYLGKRWCITNIEIEYPRIALTIGGLYNGE